MIHVDPRFTRTSALADLHVPIRAGTRHRLPRRDRQPHPRERALVPRVRARLHERRDDHRRGLRGHRGPRRAVLGLGPGARRLRHGELAVRGRRGDRRGRRARDGRTGRRAGARRARRRAGAASRRRRTRRFEHPRCVFQLLQAALPPLHARDGRARSAACRASSFLEVAEALCANSGRERTSAFCYSVGWTQHTVGVQYIRTAAIIQLLLGNIGRPGGGILALRGHASIQGSTDIPTLYNILPGYLPMPHAERASAIARLRRAQHAPRPATGATPTPT